MQIHTCVKEKGEYFEHKTSYDISIHQWLSNILVDVC